MRIVDQDCCALSGKTQCKGTSNATTCSGDDDCFSLEHRDGPPSLKHNVSRETFDLQLSLLLATPSAVCYTVSIRHNNVKGNVAFSLMNVRWSTRREFSEECIMTLLGILLPHPQYH